MLLSVLRASKTSLISRGKVIGTSGGKIQNAALRLHGTRSNDSTAPPSAIAAVHLEDGTTFIGRSFGAHKSVEGEVCIPFWSIFTLEIDICDHLVLKHFNFFNIIKRLFLLRVWLDIPNH